MRILTLLVAIVAALGVLARLIGPKRPRHGRRAKDRNVDIRVTAPQQPAQQDPNDVTDLIRGVTIHYWVQNDSAGDVRVTLENFKKKSTGQAREPLRFPQGHGVAVPAGHRRQIVGIVDVDPDTGEDTTRFKYDIRIAGGAVNDPELEIRRPTKVDTNY